MNDKNCFGCLHAKWYVANGGFEFLGCRYPPYKGKWVAEISKCPQKYLRSETMKSVMLSIQSKWCELIASGKKTVEVRKTRPKIETPFKCYIYQTKKTWLYDIYGIIADWQGKVIGEFVCNKIEEIRQREVFNADVLCSTTCLTIKEFLDYIGNATAYLWHISDLIVYDKPKELSEFRKSGALSYDDWLYSMYNGTSESSYEKYLFPFTLTRPPQSWCYVETEN